MKLYTVFKRAAEVVMDPAVEEIAYFRALEIVCNSNSLKEAAEKFAEPYVFGDHDAYGGRTTPQGLAREERSILFGFLAEIAKQAGK